jgi:hypothetical protein
MADYRTLRVANSTFQHLRFQTTAHSAFLLSVLYLHAFCNYTVVLTLPLMFSSHACLTICGRKPVFVQGSASNSAIYLII